MGTKVPPEDPPGMLDWHSLIWPHISHQQYLWSWGEAQEHSTKSLESQGSQPGQLDLSWQELSQNGQRAEARDDRPCPLAFLRVSRVSHMLHQIVPISSRGDTQDVRPCLQCEFFGKRKGTGSTAQPPVGPAPWPSAAALCEGWLLSALQRGFWADPVRGEPSQLWRRPGGSCANTGLQRPAPSALITATLNRHLVAKPQTAALCPPSRLSHSKADLSRNLSSLPFSSFSFVDFAC